MSGNENNAASATPHKELASEGLFEVLGTSTALQWWDVCSVSKHVFRHCLNDADICLYLLSVQTSGWNKLCGREATCGPWGGGDRGWDTSVATMTSCGPTCVLHGCSGFPFPFLSRCTDFPSTSFQSLQKLMQELQKVARTGGWKCSFQLSNRAAAAAGWATQVGRFHFAWCSPTNPVQGMKKLCPTIKITLLCTFSKWSQQENVREVKFFF